ncbi:FMN-binding protein [Bacillaceae bacterium IKA-2]|nr:FMN-binding protein [Bacillaceae bacterium IKA-2]
MKKISLLFMMMFLAITLILMGCNEDTAVEEEQPDTEEPAGEETPDGKTAYDDGTYRGIYGDRDQLQVSFQFELEDNVFTDVGFRQLAHGENDYRLMEEGDEGFVFLQQYEQAIAYLVGKPLEAFNDLYSPEDFVDDIDGNSGATIRSSKIVSAIKDGLNRGLYNPANDDFSRAIGTYDDGAYRGIYGDRDQLQVGFQFELEGNVFTDVSFRQLAHGENDYRLMEEGDEGYEFLQQYEQAIAYLVGKPLEAIYDLHSPGDFVDDVDGNSGATIRSNKIFSAIKDGLNRGLYKPSNEDFSRDMSAYEDGRYRGIYGDRDLLQVSIQFEIEENVFTDVSFRQLAHDENDYRLMEEGDEGYEFLQQYEQAIAYLVGKPLEAIYDLHSPGDFVDDVDGNSGATIRSNKVFSAIKDGLNRGIY